MVPTRRELLIGGGTAGMATLSGCISDTPLDNSGGGSGENDPKSYTVESSIDIENDSEDVDFSITQQGDVVNEDSRVGFVFQLSNDGDAKLLGTGPPAPFGIVSVDPEDQSDRSVFLWNGDYRESGHVDTESKDVVGAEDIGLSTEISRGQSVERTYHLSIDTPRIESGTYRLEGGYDVMPVDDQRRENLSEISIEGSVEIASQE